MKLLNLEDIACDPNTLQQISNFQLQFYSTWIQSWSGLM
jgi:hypothetical protein